MVIVRFGTFDSTVILKSLAFEVAASMRDAQVYAVSVVNTQGEYRKPYGLSFVPGSVNYSFFRYTGVDTTPTADESTILNTYTLGRSIKIADVCVVSGSGVSATVTCNSDDPMTTLTRLDVSFRRPEFRALFNGIGLPVGIDNDDIHTVYIKLRSTKDPSMTWVVEIGLLGHVSVYRE